MTLPERASLGLSAVLAAFALVLIVVLQVLGAKRNPIQGAIDRLGYVVNDSRDRRAQARQDEQARQRAIAERMDEERARCRELARREAARLKADREARRVEAERILRGDP